MGSLVTIVSDSWRYSQNVVILRVELVFATVDFLFDEIAMFVHVQSNGVKTAEESLDFRKDSPVGRDDCILEALH
jgi:hypothetical protein